MKATRLNDIENLLEEQNTLSINHLCEIFNVSKNTIRRDIAELEKRGTIKKVYGGIMRNQTNIPEPFAAREIKNRPCGKSKPPVNWWFAQTLKGFNAGAPVNGYRNLATHHYSLAAAMSRLSFLPYLFLIPVNGSMYSLMLIWSCIRSSSNCFLMYSWITRSFRPTVVHYLDCLPL